MHFLQMENRGEQFELAVKAIKKAALCAALVYLQYERRRGVNAGCELAVQKVEPPCVAPE